MWTKTEGQKWPWQRLEVLEDLGRARLQSVEKRSQGRVWEPLQSCGQGTSDMVLPFGCSWFFSHLCYIPRSAFLH